MATPTQIIAVGATQVTITAGGGVSNYLVVPPAGCNYIRVGYVSGGSLAIVNNALASAAGASASNGYLISTTTDIPFEGAARFYLAASGTNSVAKLAFGYSYGFSTFP